MRVRLGWMSVAVVLVLTTAKSAHANCALGSHYGVTVDGNTVSITLENYQSRVCPDDAGMVRVDTATGATVRLADVCGPSDGGQPPSYVDECVPPGAYHYGLARPYECERSACSTSLFVAANVSSALDGGCTRSAGSAAPTSVPAVGWSPSGVVCTAGGCGCGAGGAASSVLLADGLVVAVAVLILRRRQRR